MLPRKSANWRRTSAETVARPEAARPRPAMRQSSTRAEATGECRDLLASRLRSHSQSRTFNCWLLRLSQRRLSTALKAAQKLAANAPTEAEGLYWETRSAQNLATNALARASRTRSQFAEVSCVAWGHLSATEVFRGCRTGIPPGAGSERGRYGRPVRLVFDAAGQGRSDEALRVTQAALNEASRRSRTQRCDGGNPFHSARFCRGRAIPEERPEHQTRICSACACFAGKGVCQDEPNAGSDRGVKARARQTIRTAACTIRLPASI